jgi:riboflavin kinase/FMN adenylyltransferase
VYGTVIKGQQLASRLGYPSANIEYPEEKIQIPHGVYYVTVEIEGKTYNGVLNHGFAPTITNESTLKTEVHILDFNKNIYGEKIKISFVTKIRNQMKFENIEKLKAQLLRDKAFVEIYKHFLDKNIHLSCKRLFL